MSDIPTDQPLTRRQRRELETAALSSAPQGVTESAPTVATPAVPSPHPFHQFFDAEAPTDSAPLGADLTPLAADLELAAPASSIASESVELPPFVASAYPKRTARPAKKKASPPKSRTRSTSSRSPRAARVSSRLFSMVAMLFAGALLVGVSVPANAIMSPVLDPEVITTAAFVPGQSLAVSSDVVDAAASPKRELPTVTSYAELLRERYGTRVYTYAATTGAVRWPFPFAVPITDGYGERVAPCRGCSTFHQGVDFTPGDGTPITAIAAGTVVFTEVTNSGIGNQVQIEHSIGGKKITSVYAGMQMNSSPLRVGDAIKVGDFVGLVGATGVATGPHLHFELLVEGTKVDPFAWLKKNATNAG